MDESLISPGLDRKPSQISSEPMSAGTLYINLVKIKNSFNFDRKEDQINVQISAKTGTESITLRLEGRGLYCAVVLQLSNYNLKIIP